MATPRQTFISNKENLTLSFQNYFIPKGSASFVCSKEENHIKIPRPPKVEVTSYIHQNREIPVVSMKH